ncbi:MAG TPA: carbohydrate ABC transporter permease, partial [Castellaniella sp.]|nr:carbohydrate ABC transporter permease [Castellaniella sp.]
MSSTSAAGTQPARHLGRKSALYIGTLLFVIFSALPFYVMLITTFKTQADVFTPSVNPFWFHHLPTLDNLRLLFEQTQYVQWLLNTVYVGVAVVLITLVLSVPAAYGLARIAGGWGETLGIGIFLTYLIPPTLLFIPFSKVIAFLGLQNSMGALIVAYPTFTVPFCTWLLMGFFKGIPRDIEEQAMIDGHNRFSAFLHVVLPLAIPGILTVIVFAFTLSTSEFIYALAFVTRS